MGFRHIRGQGYADASWGKPSNTDLRTQDRGVNPPNIIFHGVGVIEATPHTLTWGRGVIERSLHTVPHGTASIEQRPHTFTLGIDSIDPSVKAG